MRVTRIEHTATMTFLTFESERERDLAVQNLTEMGILAAGVASQPLQLACPKEARWTSLNAVWSMDQLTAIVATIYDRAAAQDPDLWGHALLDLVADNTTASLSDLKVAIVAAGLHARVNGRLRRQIEAYR
jgi:hypothetical protein